MPPFGMVAILDLSNMAPTAGVQLGSREKSKVYDLGYKFIKNMIIVKDQEWYKKNERIIKKIMLWYRVSSVDDGLD